MRNVCQLAARSYRRKKARLFEYLNLPFVLLRIWWESPADAAEEVRYFTHFPPPYETPPMRRITAALRRRASSAY